MGTVQTFTAVRRPAEPLGARIAADLFGRFTRWMSTPAAPRRLSRAEESAQVREMAYRVMASDPGFASDLFAAADRHEVLAD